MICSVACNSFLVCQVRTGPQVTKFDAVWFVVVWFDNDLLEGISSKSNMPSESSNWLEYSVVPFEFAIATLYVMLKDGGIVVTLSFGTNEKVVLPPYLLQKAVHLHQLAYSYAVRSQIRLLH
jgi:hypothetical protein